MYVFCSLDLCIVYTQPVSSQFVCCVAVVLITCECVLYAGDADEFPLMPQITALFSIVLMKIFLMLTLVNDTSLYIFQPNILVLLSGSSFPLWLKFFRAAFSYWCGWFVVVVSSPHQSPRCGV